MKKETDNNWSVFSLAFELGYMIAIPIVLFALGGRFLDKKIDSSPLFLLTGIFISIILTTYLVYKKTINVIESEAEHQKSSDDITNNK